MRDSRIRGWISRLLIAALLVQLIALVPGGLHPDGIGYAEGEQGAGDADSGSTMSVTDAVTLGASGDPGSIGSYAWEQITGQNQFVPDARHSAAMAYDVDDDNVVLFGGQETTGSNSGLLNDTWIWDGEDQEWQEVNLAGGAAKPSARKGAAIAYDPASGHVLLFGGQDGSGGALSDTWLWDGTTQKWEQVNAAGPSARTYSQMAYYFDGDGSGKVVLFGGISGSSIRGDTWVWDGASKTWSLQSPATNPPALHSGAMAFDGTQAVLFGGDMGQGAGVNGVTHELSNTELWQWDGTTWTNARGPERYSKFGGGELDYGRWAHAMAYDGRRVVYYGGQTEWVGYNDGVVRQMRPTHGVTYVDYNRGNPNVAYSWREGGWEGSWNGDGSGYSAYLEAGYYPDVNLWPYTWATPRTYASMAFDGTNFILFGGVKDYMTIYKESVNTGNPVVHQNIDSHVTNETWTFGYIPPTPPVIELQEPIVALLDKATREDRVSILTDVTSDGTKPILERGVEYREVRGDGEEEAAWTKAKVEGADGTAKGAVTVHLDNTPAANTLEWQVEYEIRAYAVNAIGTGYSDAVRFKLTEDAAMVPPDVNYIRVGPAFLHSKDKKRMVAVGDGIINLLRKPANQIHYRLRQGNEEYPLSYRIRSDSELELTWEENLPDGKYDLVLEHDFYDDEEFAQALTITSLNFYKPRNFGVVEVNSASPQNQVDKLTLRGLFTETPEAPGLYALSDIEEPVMINESVLFKGTSLEVDKRANPHTIRGNGRLYVNSKGTAETPMAYTLLEGEWTITADDFSIAVAEQADVDYLGMGFPVRAASVAFTQSGVRMSGTIDLSFMAGNRKVDGRSTMEQLDFQHGQFELKGSFPINRAFAVGPIDATGMTWNIDSRFGYAGAKAEAQMAAYNMDFEMYMDIKHSRLDGIRFGMYRSAKSGASGTQVDYLYGSVDGLAKHSQLPQTFQVSGAASDVFAPELNKLNLIETYDLDIDLSRYSYRAGGDMFLYWFPVADLEHMVVLNSNAAGIKGLNGGGFATTGKLNAFDLFVGPMTLTYVNKIGFFGQMKATVHIPNSIPSVGGRTVHNVPVSIDAKGMYASFNVNGMGVNITYLFKKNIFDFQLISPPPKPSGWMKVFEVLDTVNTFADALDGDIEAGLELFDMAGSLFKRTAVPSAARSSFSMSKLPFSPQSVVPMSSASAGGPTVKLTYKKQLLAETVHPGAVEAASAAVRLDGSRFTAIARHVSPNAELLQDDPSGHKLAYSFPVERSYEALLVLDGDRTGDLRLTDPSGKAVKLNADNMLYADGFTYLRVSLERKGTWLLTVSEAVSFTVYECQYLNAGSSMAELADAWTSVSDRNVTMLPINRRGQALLTISETWDEAVVYKPDGRPYKLVTDEAAPNWNAYRDSDTGILYVLADVTELGDWFVDGGGHAEVHAYYASASATPGEVRQWVQTGSYPTRVQLTASKQVLLEIHGADAGTTVLHPDGTEYVLKTDYRKGDWNAYYDSSQKQMTVLLDAAEAGEWTVQGGSFADVKAYRFDIPFENLRPLFLKGERTRTMKVDIPKPGTYMLAVVGGTANTKITAPEGKKLALVFEGSNAAQNAILQRWEDRVQGNAGTLDQASIETAIPDPGRQDVLYVTIDAKQAGTWSVSSDKKFQLLMNELPALPELGEVAARAAGANQYELSWNVKHAAPDTRVTVMVTHDPEQPIGQVVAEDLPAADVRTIDIPSGFIPGQYYLSVMAQSSTWPPMTHVIAEPIQLTASYSLPVPQAPEAVSTGNGEVTLQLHQVDDSALSHYRVFVLKEDGSPDYGKPAYDASPDQLELVLAGLQTGETYRFGVMAIGEKDGMAAFSPLSPAVEAHLPVPQPAALEVELAAGSPSDAAIVERKYRSYDDEEETLLITSAETVSVQVRSSQAAEASLYVNGALKGSLQSAAGSAIDFDLNELLGAAKLKENHYDLIIEAVNAAGDKSTVYRKLYVDRTGPYLYAAYAENPEEGLNGLVVRAARVPMVGQTDAGSKLTVNGVQVPLDEAGRFLYYAPWPDSGTDDGKFSVHMVAEDEAGNRTESKFEALQNNKALVARHPAELAALTLGHGSLDAPFDPEQDSYATVQPAGPLQVHAVPAADNAVVTVNGQALGADGSVQVDIPAAGRTLTIQVDGAGSSVKTYTVQVYGEASDVAMLQNLTLSAGVKAVPLNLAFAGSQNTYRAAVAYETAEVTVRPTALMAGTTIVVNGSPVSSGTSAAVNLTAGQETPVTIVATSANGQVTKTYSLKVWREGDANARLSQLSIAGRQLIPAFDGDRHDYQVMVPEGTTTVSIAAAAAGEGAVVRIGGEERSTADIPLARNVQSIEVEVEAMTGIAQTYKIQVQRQSTKKDGIEPPYLEQLLVGAVRMEAQFSPYRLTYKATATRAGSTTVIAQASDPGAIVTVNGKPVSETGTAIVGLNLGANAVVVRVESADRTASRSYAVEFVREQEDNASVRTVPVQTGSKEGIVVAVTRSKTASGAKVDTVRVDKNKAQEIVQEAKKSELGYARIIVTDLPDDLAEEYELNIPSQALSELAGGSIRMIAAFPNAEIALPKETVRKLQAEGTELYFRIVPIRKAAEQQQVEQRMLKEEVVLKAADGREVIRVGMPVTIETNYSGYATQILFPLDGLALPEDEKESKRILDSLAVYIEHSDGERVLRKGTIRYGADGKPEGIEIEVEKFSTFTLIRTMNETGEDTDLAPYMSGYPDGNFRPSQALTRAEAASILARSLAYRSEAQSNEEAGIGELAASYADVPSGHWASEAVKQVREAGLMLGDENGRFRLSATITRAEMAAIVARWNGWSEANVSAGFADTAGHWADRLIARVRSEGIMKGYPDGNFRPSAPLLRAEAVRVLNAMFGRPVSAGTGNPIWPDVATSHWAYRDIESASSRIRLYADGSAQVQRAED
jgi:hypothetical protein